MVKIRLRRMGATKRPSYRIIAAEAWGPRDGRFLETLGHYNPLTEPATVVLNEERLVAWLQQGAQPTDSVARILKRQGIALPEKAISVIRTNRAAARGIAAATPPPAPAPTSRRRSAAASAVAPAAPTPIASAPDKEETPAAEVETSATKATEESSEKETTS